jgi:DNA-binding MarR family transcriptional regulator
MPRAKAPLADPVRRIQRAYPQIYLACHVDHTTRRREHRLSDRDASVLAHLDDVSPVTAGALAKHLGIGPSTLTEAIDRLEDMGLVERTRRGRTVELRITLDGIAQMQSSNVLDTDRVAKLVAAVPPRHRAAAVAGIELLADAARRLAKTRA